MEQLDFNLLFRWFVGFEMDAAVWDHSTFTHNRDRLLAESLMRDFFGRVVVAAHGFGLMSDEHFSVDGTMIEARGPEVDFKGE